MKYLISAIILIYSSLIHSQDISKLIDEYTASYVSTGDFSGCILITENDKITYENCFGFANRTFNVLNKKQTKFRIGSISKQFTAVAILILEQKGLLKTTDYLSDYFPQYPITSNITLKQLLNHTSGVTDIYDIPDFNKLSCHKKTISDMTKLILETELDFEPGTQYLYSNGGYIILAKIIEIVGETTYPQFLNEHIFKPLNMNSTGHEEVDHVIPNLATGYDPMGYDDIKTANFLDPELLKGSGSLYSTVHDLKIWINSLKYKSLLAESAYETFFKDYGHNYGYGISVYTSFSRNVFGHDGRVNGYIADYLHYIEPDISIIILGNIQTGVADFFRRDIAAIVFNQDYESKAKKIPAADHKFLNEEEILGTYSFGPNFKVHIERINQSIQARANEGGYSELVLLKDGRYFNRTLYSYIEFVADEHGDIIKMVWINNDGNSFEGQKE